MSSALVGRVGFFVGVVMGFHTGYALCLAGVVVGIWDTHGEWKKSREVRAGTWAIEFGIRGRVVENSPLVCFRGQTWLNGIPGSLGERVVIGPGLGCTSPQRKRARGAK